MRSVDDFIRRSATPLALFRNDMNVYRIAVFGSFYRGWFVLDELLSGPLRQSFEVVGVATDDVERGRISRDKRVWRYPHEAWERTMVADLAARHGIPVFTGDVKTEAFRNLYRDVWRPDLCIAATFGQLIDAPLFEHPRIGFFNAHPCIEGSWPSPYAGPNPFQALIDDRRSHTKVALHRIDAGIDTGELVAMSPRIAIPPGVGVVDLHKISSPVVARFVVERLRSLAEAAGAAPEPACL